MASHEVQARTLVEALPYIQQFTGKTIVVKYGGNAMVSDELRKAVMSDIILLNLVGIRVVMVHGGGPEINDMLKKIGHQSRFVDGLRYTDRETMDIVQSVLCGKVNKDLVAQINRLGGRAVGLCGMDGALFQAVQLDEKYGLVGRITGVDPKPVESALENHYIPVVSTVAQGVDADTAYNINADTAAAKLAEALRAEKLILLTDVRGLLRDPKDEDTLIRVVQLREIPALMQSGIISGGMIPKIQCCAAAISGGVDRVQIIDGRIPHSILIELLSDEGIGTMLRRDETSTLGDMLRRAEPPEYHYDD
ncbi:MAG: acetylglutamate kinase [Oscillibacter sp.]|nr:acetylglutamate kinase [Oscillibacter sp.]